ncbi:MAG: HAD hydrolase family protein [Bacilli bacterium]|nr:HAD hydrolase family protein [Bacilli bacterium]
MEIPKIGKRIIKTVIAVFLSISVYIILLVLGDKFNLEILPDMYTPFYAAIAAVYALHRNKKSSFNQAKIRAFGSVVGGYYGMLVIMLSEWVLIDGLNLLVENYVLYYLFTFLIVSVAIIPLIWFTVFVKQNTSVFITCLTFFSVTISSRNGGLPVELFATNRVISTLIGIGISLLVNNISLIRNKNKNLLFVTSLENNLLNSSSNTISPYIKYKLNNLYYNEMPLTFATTRTLSSLEYLFDDVDIDFPLVVMNGSAIYHFKDKSYDNVYTIDSETRYFIDEKIAEFDMNAFTYSVEDNMLHCHYSKLSNEGEISFYQIRRANNFDNFVRASMPSDLEASLFIIIDTKENIDKLVQAIECTSYTENVDLIVTPYYETPGDFYHLKINSKASHKENLINKLKLDNNLDDIIVCASGKTDLGLISKSMFSFCLNSAPHYIREKVDVIIGNNPEEILKVFEKIYRAHNVRKTINRLKKKYQGKKYETN